MVKSNEYESGDSPLVATLREYSQRWQPIPPDKGSLKVIIAPQEAINQGAQWRVGEGKWQDSQTTSDNLLVGSYEVEFQSTADWKGPVKIPVQIAKDQTSEITATYTKIERGALQVVLSPQEAVKDGAQWRLDGGAWQENEVILNDILAEAHEIDFKTTTDWKPPEKISLEVIKDETIIAAGSYTIIPRGSLQVSIAPEEAVEDGAQWKVDNGEWQNSDANVSRIVAGPHEVQFKATINWEPPVKISAEITKDETANITGTYTIVPQGNIQVSIGPPQAIAAGAQWRVKEDEWKNNSDIIKGAKEGTYNLEFKEVKGWTRPEEMTVKVTKDQTTQTTVNYQRTRPPDPDFAIVGTIMLGKDDGYVWIKLPEEKKDKAFRVGETIKGYRLVRVSDGSAQFERDGFDYKLEVPDIKKTAVKAVVPPVNNKPLPPEKLKK